MLKIIQTLFFLSFISPLTVSNCFAQDSGRLEDGRAFRTGPSGFKIMDEVAELEVGQSDMKKRILALEYELEQKNSLIERIGGTKYLNSESVVEKDLLSKTSSGLPKAMTADSLRKKEELCGDVVGKLNREVETLKRQITDNARVQSAQASQKAQSSSQISSLQAEIQGLRSAQASSDSSKQRLQQEVANLQERLSLQMNNKDSETASLNSLLQSSQQANIDLQSQVDSLQSRISQVSSDYETRVANLRQENLENQSSRAKLIQPAPARARIVSPPTPSRAYASRAKGFKTELRGIQSKILKRKSQIDRLKKTKKGISIPARKLRTKAGVSLDTLRSEIRNGGQMSTPEIESSLREITAILNEDIRTTGRLLR